MSNISRIANSRDWQPLSEANYDEFQPLAIDADSNELYALKKLNGRSALYTIKLDGSMSEKLVASNPRVDIDDVVRFGDGQRVIGYAYAEDKRFTVYFDPEFKALSASLSKALPQLPLVEFVDSSHDGQRLLIHAGSDTDPGLLCFRPGEEIADSSDGGPAGAGRAHPRIREAGHDHRSRRHENPGLSDASAWQGSQGASGGYPAPRRPERA
jgi:hypothetical protein